MTLVLTAENHRCVPAGCDCTWKQPWPGKPWVLVTPNPRCRNAEHHTLDQAAGRRRYWQAVHDAAEERIGQLKPFMAAAQTQLAKLGGAHPQ